MRFFLSFLAILGLPLSLGLGLESLGYFSSLPLVSLLGRGYLIGCPLVVLLLLLAGLFHAPWMSQGILVLAFFGFLLFLRKRSFKEKQAQSPPWGWLCLWGLFVLPYLITGDGVNLDFIYHWGAKAVSYAQADGINFSFLHDYSWLPTLNLPYPPLVSSLQSLAGWGSLPFLPEAGISFDLWVLLAAFFYLWGLGKGRGRIWLSMGLFVLPSFAPVFRTLGIGEVAFFAWAGSSFAAFFSPKATPLERILLFLGLGWTKNEAIMFLCMAGLIWLLALKFPLKAKLFHFATTLFPGFFAFLFWRIILVAKDILPPSWLKGMLTTEFSWKSLFKVLSLFFYPYPMGHWFCFLW